MNTEKERRMQLRRESDTRPLPPVEGPAPRQKGGPGYLIAHACFACRKSFKRKPREGGVVCPHCAGTAHEMGRYFRAPPKRDLEQWEKVRRLHAAGFRFGRARSTKGPPLPARLADVDAFIRDNPEHSLRVARQVSGD